ncbi:MAG: hypothetical protein AUH85_15680 [Chloroflexi bacterium 13_1_40CM_4_68_4]|nr:MAG: hypothetical protein AUH85_15680 [Chloroflexi bacterium 13_1_40CM_4_68_4]
MKLDRGDLAYAAGLLLGVLVLVGLGVPALWADFAPHGDFAQHWFAARTMSAGGDPYDPTVWPRFMATLGGAPAATSYASPPYVPAALAPFALLRLDDAVAVWTVLGIALAALAVRSLLRTADVPHAVRLVFGFTLLASQASIAAILQGGFGFYLAAALAFALAWQGTVRQLRAGAAALVLAAQPQAFLFAWWSIIATAWRYREVRVLTVFALAGEALLASLALVPTLWQEWARGTSPLDALSSSRAVNVLNLFNFVGGDRGPYLAAGLVLLLTLVAIVVSPFGGHPIWVALTFVAAPFLIRSDQVALVVPLAIAVGMAGRTSQRTALVMAAIGALVLAPVAAILFGLGLPSGGDPYGAVVALAVFALVAFVRTPPQPA